MQRFAVVAIWPHLNQMLPCQRVVVEECLERQLHGRIPGLIDLLRNQTQEFWVREELRSQVEGLSARSGDRWDMFAVAGTMISSMTHGRYDYKEASLHQLKGEREYHRNRDRKSTV